MTPPSSSLFDAKRQKPLAERLRPLRLDDVTGQDHLLGADGKLKRMVEAAKSGQMMPSLILWGPPGTGKTTIARLLAAQAGLAFEPVSAVFDGVAELRKVFARADERGMLGEGTLLFVDEVHRFNKAQQDGLLPHVEDGRVTLVGATTENPSFALNGALLSRCQVLVLNRLDDAALDRLISRAEEGEGRKINVDDDARAAMKAMADGDGRYLLNMVETVLAQQNDGEAAISPDELTKVLSQRAAAFDRAGDQHYNLMSALHKSLRSSDADAALYWLARMFVGGEDPRYILRRLVRFASEDIGLAEPEALNHAISAWNSYERLGSPEGELAVAALVLYLATAPKSNAAYTAFKAAMRAARDTGSLMPPKHILNAPTGLMKDLGYGDGYVYDHDTADGFSGQNCFPDDMPRQVFYQPVERGFERDIKKRLEWWDKKRREKPQE
ncbi:MAG: replication-associated recombination protein A [Alphaproteobacteria bacterium]|nr:replication-associated recombination protein A [Alphaproteobacteria bacterium]